MFYFFLFKILSGLWMNCIGKSNTTTNSKTNNDSPPWYSWNRDRWSLASLLPGMFGSSLGLWRQKWILDAESTMAGGSGGSPIRVCSMFVVLVYYEISGTKHLPLAMVPADLWGEHSGTKMDEHLLGLLNVTASSGSEELCRFVKTYHFLLHLGVSAQ